VVNISFPGRAGSLRGYVTEFLKILELAPVGMFIEYVLGQILPLGGKGGKNVEKIFSG
jgi:hypothetical protein